MNGAAEDDLIRGVAHRDAGLEIPVGEVLARIELRLVRGPSVLGVRGPNEDRWAAELV